MTTLLVGLDGHGSGERACQHAQSLATLIGECQLVLAYVIEWSPYSFQTAEENAQRHKRREEEISIAFERVVDPAKAKLVAAGFNVIGVVRHGDVANTLNGIATEHRADQIIVGRSSEGGVVNRLFGSATSNLVMSADIPVTVVK